MQIKTAYLSDSGGRAINDDFVKIIQEQGIYIFVGDGLGGYAGGKMASQTAAEAFTRAAKRGNLICDGNLLLAAKEADEAVKRLQAEQNGKMKTTCVFLCIEDKTARWMHIGDSRLYHFRQNKLKAQTKDHSVSQLAALLGEITADQIRFHEDRSRVLKALGSESAKPDISMPLTTEAGDAFLLCTDGFWEFVYEAEMENLLQTAAGPEEWLRAMEKLLRTRISSDTDNYTAAAVFVSK